MKLGSLFDGSGGFPLAATMSGITPVWASEVEPYPIAVTRSRFPKMKHLGDISRVNGAEIEPVDIISFGSPCQSLSIEGKREGIKHTEHGDEETTRSGLFYEAIRIIKEMRENDKASGRAGVDIRPRYIVWENVPGAFSSNGGRDFRLVLEEIIKIVEPQAVMPDVPKGGWAHADSYRGDGWSVAYRVFDAQYWGVPQRRRRIYLVADFGGQCAQEIQFKRDRLQGYVAESGRTPWQAVTPDTERSPLTADREGGKPTAISMNWQAAVGAGLCGEEELTNPLSCTRTPAICFGFDPGASRDVGVLFIEECGKTLTNGTCPGHHNGVVIAFDRAAFKQGENAQYDFEVSDSGVNSTIVAKGPSGVCYVASSDGDVAGTLDASYYKGTGMRSGIERTYVAEAYGVDAWNGTETPESIGSLQASAEHNINSNNTVRTQYIVRRLTPTECARLQGFPDRWGTPVHKDEMTAEEYGFWREVRMTYDRISGRKEKTYTDAQILKWYNALHNDGAEYKMWGNGIALPCALFIMRGIVEVSK